MVDQILTFAIIGVTLVLFVLERWRYDLVAMMALLTMVILGIVPGAKAFSGFGHPAVITVAAVLIISQGLLSSGAVDVVTRLVARAGSAQIAQLTVLTALVALFSGFMNNIGALALFLPVGLRAAKRTECSPSLLLMPLAFGSILGGMMTLIGTPPNIIIAMARADATGQPFRMFDFAPVGISVAISGVVFIVLIGWRLLPRRESGSKGEIRIEQYMSEVRVPAGSRYEGKPLRDLAPAEESEVVVLAIVRDGRHYPAPSRFEQLRAGDVLIVEADAEGLQEFIDRTGMMLAPHDKFDLDEISGLEAGTAEAVVMPNSPMIGRSSRDLDMRRRYGVSLLAVARHGLQIEEKERTEGTVNLLAAIRQAPGLRTRLGRIVFQPGDIVLLYGRNAELPATLDDLGCLPLTRGPLQIARRVRALPAVGLFAAGLILATMQLLPIHVALSCVAAGMVLAGLISIREVYDSINWSIIILLGAMITVGGALEATGGADRIADLILAISGSMPPSMSILVLMVATTVIANVTNTATSAVLMAPIAIAVACGMGASVDPFLIAVAIAASTAYLTPTAHQSNLLVMGPGGYRYGDYWKLGLPLTALVLAVALPLTLLFWPL